MELVVGLGEGGLFSTKYTTNRLRTFRGDAPCRQSSLDINIKTICVHFVFFFFFFN